jgi:hypothetical protein
VISGTGLVAKAATYAPALCSRGHEQQPHALSRSISSTSDGQISSFLTIAPAPVDLQLFAHCAPLTLTVGMLRGGPMRRLYRLGGSVAWQRADRLVCAHHDVPLLAPAPRRHWNSGTPKEAEPS